MSKIVPILVLAGNHDVVDDGVRSIDLTDGKKGYLRSSLVYPFKISGNIFVIDEPLVQHFDDNKVTISFIPYSTDILSSLDQINKELRSGYTNIMIGHFETKDINYVSLIKDTSIYEKIPSSEDLFKIYKQKLVLLGHVHDGSIIEKGNNKLIYLGSSRNINFNNRIEEKGIHILDVDTLDISFIANDSTAIYKVFRDPSELEEYLDSTSNEKLAKTKIKFVYSDPKDTLKFNCIKKRVRKIEFEKNIFSSDNTITDDSRIKLEELKIESIADKANLFKFVLQFKEVLPDEQTEYLNFINSFGKEEDS
jgi:DNA repair exonuclease SbcCD nuclease subunit